MVRIPQTSFARGEISPALYPMQNDVTRQGCVELENAIITENGGVKKRTGFAYNAQLGTNSTNFQLIPCRLEGYSLIVGITYDTSDARAKVVVWQPSDGAYDSGGGIIGEDEDQFLAGWDQADCAQIQYVQTEEAVYVATTTGDAPPYRFGKKNRRPSTSSLLNPTNPEWWSFQYLGEDARIGDSPIYRVSGPPFELTIAADSRGTPGTNTFHVTSPVPVFSQEDEDSVRPWMFTYPEDGNDGSFNTGTPVWAYVESFKSPTEAFFKQFSEKSGGGVDIINAGQTLDWYGPWTSQVGGPYTSVSVSSLAHTALMTVTFNTSGDASAFQPGDIINFAGGTFTHCAILTCQKTATTFDAFMLADDGTSGSSGLSGTRWSPEAAIPSLDLFCMGNVSGGNLNIFSQRQEFNSAWQEITTGTARPGGQIEINGGLLTATTSGPDAYLQLQMSESEGLQSYYPTSRVLFRGDGKNGWASAVEFHQDRLFIGGTDGASVVASRTGAYDQWSLGSDADDALLFKVAQGRGEKVKWLASAGDLLIGTDQAEYAMSGALTPTNVGVDRQSNYGGSGVQPVKTDGQVMFVEADGETIRVTNYRYETEQYVAQAITDYAEHLFDGNPIKQIVHYKKPDRLILAVMDDGTVLALSYRPEVGIAGWSRWTGLEDFESLAVLPGGTSDTIYATHAYNSARQMATWPSTVYMDYHRSELTLGASKVHNDLAHLEGLPVQVLVNTSVYIGFYTVDTGAITVQTASNPANIIAGQLINFQMIPFPPETVDRGSGTTLGQRKSYPMARVRVRLSRDVRVADRLLDSTNMPDETQVDSSPPTSAPPLKGGWYTVRALGKTPDDETPPKFESLSPYLCEFNAVVLDVDFGTE